MFDDHSPALLGSSARHLLTAPPSSHRSLPGSVVFVIEEALVWSAPQRARIRTIAQYTGEKVALDPAFC